MFIGRAEFHGIAISLLALISVAPTAPAVAQKAIAAPTPIADSLVAKATTNHGIRIGDKEIRYEATWSEVALKDESGVPQATISATSYVRDGPSKANRPVMFLFNGGPGASSSPLHFSAFGPRRRDPRDASGAAPMLDNEACLIDVADLVFIDPVGTGFSRELKEGGGKSYWGLSGDARSVLALIRDWLRENKRTKSPVFIAGESYGGMRLALMAKDLSDLTIAGLILISPVTDMTANASATGNDLPFIFDLPSMAVAAWTYRKPADDLRKVEDVWEAARAYAQGDYAVALQQGSALPAEVRARIAEELSRLIGLPAATIEAANLRVDTQDFLETLLADQNKIVGRLDTRVAASKPERPINPDRPAAANDPSLGLGRTNVIKSDSAAAYYRDELNVETTRDYYSLTLDVNFNWNWRDEASGIGPSTVFYLNATPNIAALMKEKPKLRVMLASGYFDLATPVLGQRYALLHGGLPLDRLEMVALASSHSPYDDDNRPAFAEMVRQFVRKSVK